MEYTESELALADYLGVSNSPYLYELIKEVNGRVVLISEEIKNGLTRWLQYELWEAHEGLFLLAGLNPNIHQIYKWTDPLCGEIYPKDNLDGFVFFHEVCTTSLASNPREPDFSDHKEHNSERWRTYEKERKQYEQRHRDLRTDLESLKQMWDRSIHPSQSEKYSPDYFIQWAEKKKHQIPWLEWAKRHQIINTYSDNKQSSRPERTDRTAKKMIVGLVKALAEKGGNQYGSAEKPNIRQIYEEVIKYLPENTHGISPANFDNYYKEGLKILDQSSN